MPDIVIRLARTSDWNQLSHMRADLWPESSADEHASDLMPILDGHAGLILPVLNLVAEAANAQLVGFIEAGLRSHADGCDPSHAVGFIEGWYVDPDWRGRGIGRKLLSAAEEWARSQGCVEMASDTWIDNELSQRVHEAAGYTVVDRCVHYRKSL
jgi:aminoglycoside 6'-N-acetyltransferase I